MGNYTGSNYAEEGKIRGRNEGAILGTFSNIGDATDTGCNGLQSRLPTIENDEQNRPQKEKSIESITDKDRNLQKSGGWENFPIKSPICGRDDGIPRKLHGITLPKWKQETIKSYGNAIVPQLALSIFKSIINYQNEQK